jgi:hypothetical protein
MKLKKIEKVEAQLFKPGPLYRHRFEIVDQIKKNMRSGDILYRYSDARGPLGLPFCRIVCRITQSKYSHAAILFVENDEPYVLEVNDEGTLRYRLIDWIDTCYLNRFSVYRLKDLDEDKEKSLLKSIYGFLEEDPDYDFTFEDLNKFYCTESVIEIYKRALNIVLDEGKTLKELMPFWRYCLFCVGVKLFKLFGTSMPTDKKLYFVGNEKIGMMSSPYTYSVNEIYFD